MKKTIVTLVAISMSFYTFGQVTQNQKMIDLGKTYKDYMFRSEPTKNAIKEIMADIPENLKVATEFIAQSISTKNKLLTQPYLLRPDDQTLKQIFIIEAIFRNLREENNIDNNELIDSLTAANIAIYELIDNYYGMLFTSVGNKNQPFNFSKVDFKLADYNLKDDTEKGIFVLRCMSYCNVVIWGYMNIVKPPNTKEAYKFIKKYPKINGQSYFKFTDFYFTDFEIYIDNDKGIQSYKSYYLDKYFETLLFHLICLKKEGGTEKEKNDLLLGSILKEKNLYKYTKYKNTLENIFKEQK